MYLKDEMYDALQSFWASRCRENTHRSNGVKEADNGLTHIKTKGWRGMKRKMTGWTE